MRLRLLLVSLVLLFCQVVIAQDEVDLSNTYVFENDIQFQYGDAWQLIEIRDGLAAIVQDEIEVIFATAPFIVTNEFAPLVEIMHHAINIAEAPVPADEDIIYAELGGRYALFYGYDRSPQTRGLIAINRMNDGTIGIVDVVYSPDALPNLSTEIGSIIETFNNAPDETSETVSIAFEIELAMNANWYGSLNYNSGDLEAAISYFSEAIENYPSGLYLNNRATVYLEIGEYEAAVEDFTQSLDISNEQDYVYFQRGVAYVGLGEYELAIADQIEAIRLNSNNPLYFTDRAATNRRLGNFEDAIRDYSVAILMDGDNAVAYFLRAQVHAFMEDFDSAVADYDMAYELDPDFGTTIHLLQHYAFDEVEIAIQLYTNHINNEPEFAPLYFHRGNAYRQVGDTDAAIKDLNTYLELAGEDADPRAEEWLDDLDS